jgi:serine protease Do
LIVEFNGKKISDDRQLRLTVSQTPPNTDSTVKILRDGKEKTFKLKLAELPSRNLAAGDDISPNGNAKNDEALEGVTVDDLAPRARTQFNIPRTIEGVLVTDVDPDSKSYEAGLRPGDVIMEINQKPVRDAKEAVTLSENVKGPNTLLRIYSRGNARYLTVENGSTDEPSKLDNKDTKKQPSRPRR